MQRAGSCVGPFTSLWVSMKNCTPPNSNAPIAFSSTSKARRYQVFIVSTWEEPTRRLPRLSVTGYTRVIFVNDSGDTYSTLSQPSSYGETKLSL